MSDLINGAIEFVGALLLVHNCWLLYRHKQVQGVSVLTTAFFTAWGAWNLYFYPANNLWLSFAGGLCLATANLIWVVMAVYYSRQLKSKLVSPPSLDANDVSQNSNPLIEENRRREALLREASYRTVGVETRPWVTNVLNVEDCRRLMAELRRKEADSKQKEAEPNQDPNLSAKGFAADQ